VKIVKGKKTDLVEIILVELANEGSKVGVLEHPRENGLCELVHILDYKAVAVRAPGNHPLERGIL
jgi:hypothetical protein